MDLVVDANILFSILIKDGKSAELLMKLAFNFYVPEFIFEEIEEHKLEIMEKTHRSSKEFDEVFREIRGIVSVYPANKFKEFIKDVGTFSPDEDDNEYLALALKLNCPIWSNDYRLKKQDRIRVYTTEEIISLSN